MVDILSLAIVAVGVAVSLLVGIVVFLQNTKGILHRVFFAFALLVASLSVANHFSLFASSIEQQIWGVRTVMFCATALVLIVYLIVRYVSSTVPILMMHERVLLIITLIMGALHFTPFYFVGINTEVSSLQPLPGPGIALFFVHFVALLILSIRRLINRYLISEGRERSQYKALIVGILPTVLLAPLTSIILPMVFEQTRLIPISPLYVTFFLVCIGYAIMRHGLFDVKVAAIRTTGYMLSIGAMAAIYTMLAYTISLLFFGGNVVDGVSFSPINITLALVLALIFQPIKRFFDNLTNKLFYRGEYSPESFMREFGRILSYDTDLRLLLRQASGYLLNSLSAERVFFVIGDRGIMGSSGARKRRVPQEDISEIESYYRQNHESPEVIVFELVADESLRRLMQSHQTSMILPLMLQNTAVGYLFLGENKGSGYKTRDIQVLESIANELTIAVQNSLSVEEIRELNENLQRRVDDATKELRASNRQLQRLDEAKNEFISMASHQLRTPLTSIKGYLDMILEGDLGKVSSTQRAVLSEAFLSSERMVTLINDFLNVSRLQTGKFTIEKHQSDLVEAINEQVSMLSVVAKQHDLKLQVKIGKDIPLVNVDIDKVRQVILNMIDNAIYYSRPGTSIKISLQTEDKDVVFTVKDTGIGVPIEEQSGLFGKFFRATNARKKRPDGTGVGLFLAKKVILAHNGKIIFESAENKGSTFGFRIPFKA